MRAPTRAHRRPGILAAVTSVAALVVALAGCGSAGADDGGASGGPSVSSSAPGGRSTDGGATGATDSELSGTLTVFAAASLKTTFDELRSVFRTRHPQVDFPEITYDGSSTLAKQLQDGAPADVFASANEENMDKVSDLVTDRTDFATNSLQIAVAPGNPKDIHSLADIAASGVVTVICAPEVPCGAAAHEALDAAGVRLTPASEELNVKAVLTKVAAGEADAGLVYATDVNSSGGTVDGIDFPQAADAINTYPIAATKDSSNGAAARAFIDLVTGKEGRKVLAAVGFGPP